MIEGLVRSAVLDFTSLQDRYQVSTMYKVGFDKELSKDVLDVIKYLKGDLNPEDIVPDRPTSLTIILKSKIEPHNIIHTFHQDSKSYMDAFDEDEYKNFTTKYLTK